MRLAAAASVAALLLVAGAGAALYMKSREPPAAEKFVLATTTSTYDTGLLDLLLPKFEARYHAKAGVVSVGTGQALEYGKRGDADVLLVHAKAEELDFVAQGYGLWRRDVMYNRFVIVGPRSDPAGIGGMNSSVAAFRAIAVAGAPFCSRGDGSGTQSKELELWKGAGINASDGSTTWYLSLGQGMGETLLAANEKRAYALTDEGTWYAMEGRLGNLAVLVGGDPLLFNQYGVIPVNPANGPHVNSAAGVRFAGWLAGSEGQAAIAAFTKNGHQLFTPNAGG